MADSTASQPLLKRPTTRRVVLGGTLAAGSVAAAYAALGDKLDLFGGDGGSSTAALRTPQDTDAIEKESVRISHLLRRAGFGVTAAEHEHYQSIGLTKTVDELVNYSVIDDADAEKIAGAIPIDNTVAARQNLPLWWLVLMANTKRPLQEKMTFFLHGLLTSQTSVVRDPEAMLKQNELLRNHAMGPFPELLRAITMDPAMMVYLDMAGSQRAAPNENYARELMELFSLGVGNYTEQDIREAARALTGWAVPQNRGAGGQPQLSEPVFRPQQFDNGMKTFLGRTGNFRPEDVVSIISDQPAAARYVVARLYSFFVHPGPSDADLAPFIEAYNKNDRRLGAVVEAIFRSDAFYSPAAYRAIVKSPVDYTVSAIKALGLQSTAAQSFIQGRGLVSNMGQTPFEPPNVAGWPGGASWLNSATMFARLNFINLLTSPPPNRNGAGQAGRPGQPGQQASGQGGAPGAQAQAGQRAQQGQPAGQAPAIGDLGTASQALAHYAPMILDDNVSDEARQVIYDFAGGADNPLTQDQLRSVAYLILASPQFHLS